MHHPIKILSSIPHRFYTLDSFRGLAAICVVIYHLNTPNSIASLPFFRHSHLFVEFFFVLSGFVMNHSYARRERLQFRNFTISRFFRLYPLHLFTFLALFAYEIIKFLLENYGIHFQTTAFSGRNHVSEILPNLLFLHAWLPFSNAYGYNYPSWSLSIEFYLYLIFYITIKPFKSLKYLLWALFLSLSVYSILNGHNYKDEVFTGLFCFFAGTFLNDIYQILHQKVKRLPVFLFHISEILLVISSIIVVTQANSKSIMADLVFCITVFMFAFEKGIISKFLNQGVFQLGGRLSYSIYMVHAPILIVFASGGVIVANILDKLSIAGSTQFQELNFGNYFINNVFVFSTVIVVILCAYFINIFIEQKFMKIGKRIVGERL